MPAPRGRKQMTQYEALYGGANFSADNFLQAGGQTQPAPSGTSSLNIGTAGLLSDTDPAVLADKLTTLRNSTLDFITSNINKVSESELYNVLSNDLVVSEVYQANNYNEALLTINSLLTVTANMRNLQTVVNQALAANTGLIASSNLVTVYAASNALKVTQTLEKWDSNLTKWSAIRTGVQNERERVSNDLTANENALTNRKNAANTAINTLKSRVQADYNTLLNFTGAKGPNFPAVLSTFSNALNRLNTDLYTTLQSKFGSVPVPVPPYPGSTLLQYRNYRNAQVSRVNDMVAFEYDLQSVDIATRNIVANIQSASLGTGATKNFTSNSSEIQAILDLSGQYWNYVSLSRNDMTNKINYVTSSWDQLYSSHIDDLGNLINCNIYGDFYNLELIDSNLTQFFAVTVEDGSPMMLYDTAEDSSTRRSNVGGLVQQAANYYSNITRDATELSNRFNRYSNAIRDELTSNINTTFSEITSNISFITTVVPMIVSNMNAAYPIMAASNYTGKYTYLYDYVKAMLGMCNDILTVARTNSNGPVYAPLTDPVTSPSMDYNYSNLYYTSADGAGAPPNQIKLRRGLYQYINDRYLNLPTSYSTIQGEVNRVMSLPGVSLDNLRDKYSNLLTASVTPEIDQFQIAQYSNSIFGTSTQTGGGVAITPATKTEADLRAYIANHFRSLTDSNFAAAQETTNCLNLWNAIQSNANDVKSRVETLRSQTEADLYYLDDPAFTTITTWRSQLLDAYAQADFTLINDAQYFTGTFTNTNTNRSGSFFEVFGAAVIQALAAQALTPDNQALVDLLNAPSFVTILGTYTNARNQKRLDMQSNITNIKNNITSLKALSDNLHTSLLSNIQIDLPRLEAKKLNAACFEFYPTVVAAQAELRSNVNELQAKITEVNNIPYTSTNATLADLDTYTEDILFHSNAVNNIYLVASNYNVILTGKTDELLIAYNNAYSNIDSNIVMNLPIFTGSNCSTSNIVQVTTR